MSVQSSRNRIVYAGMVSAGLAFVTSDIVLDGSTFHSCWDVEHNSAC